MGRGASTGFQGGSRLCKRLYHIRLPPVFAPCFCPLLSPIAAPEILHNVSPCVHLAMISNRKDSGGPSPARPTSAYTVGHSRTQNLAPPVPLSEFIPPLPSTTSSLINNSFPIDDPLSHQQPHPSLTTPLLSMTPINDLIPHQLPLSYRRPSLPSTTLIPHQ